MSDTPHAQSELPVVVLNDEQGQAFSFRVLDRIRFEEQDYLLAWPENNESNQLAVIHVDNQELTLVQDQAVLNKIQALIQEMAAKSLTVTLVDEKGQNFEFQVVDEITIDGQKYLLANNSQHQQQVIVLRINGEALEPVEDQAELASVQKVLDQMTPPSDDLTVKLETAEGKEVDFTVIGKIELQGQAYLLAASQLDTDELLAIEVQGEELKLVQDESILAEINLRLGQLREQMEKEAVES